VTVPVLTRSVFSGVVAASLVAGAPRGVTVPLCAGLTIVTAINEPEGDYESIKTIASVGTASAHLRFSIERVLRDRAGHPIQKLLLNRIIRTADMRGADRYLQIFSTLSPAEVPGTTAIGTSSAVLSALKSKGTATLTMFNLPGGLPSATPYAVDPKKHPSVFDYEVPFNLRKAEPAAVMLPLTVNGAKTELPAIHATGSGELGEKGEFFFLDDDANPMALRWRLRTSSISGNEGTALQVVKIAYQCRAQGTGAGGGRLERALAEDGRVDVYEIYFSFNSDEIREESEPMLAELGDVLRRHADWKLGIEGHTDGIGGDASNLDLSKRRSASVRVALITRFGIAAHRLTTTGYGKSRPKDTNETPEGRARNRRVELVRMP
jgi:outer membrane protein OmpA-like peptidoglycan-associated protein